MNPAIDTAAEWLSDTFNWDREQSYKFATELWLCGFRAHAQGAPCVHQYGPGDHHWESGTCLVMGGSR